jgi:hypothetical protein
MSPILTYGLFCVGAWLSRLNFYLSFLRPSVHRWRGKDMAEYRFVSGIPVFGSVFLVIAAFSIQPVGLKIAAIVIAALDTCGLHWALLVLFTEWRQSRLPPGAKPWWKFWH